MTWLAQFQQGSVFAGDFEVLRPLKEGGMGAVYIAKQLSTDKPRALKLMQPQLVREPRLRKRFQDEARVAARIKSRHVVEVIGAGVDDKTGLPWLAMELLEGRDLDARVRESGPLPPHEANEVFAQLCHAMGAAHAAGIVHRDLKPENIFLGEERQVGVPFMVKVLDFGIAKIRDDAQADRTNAPVGTATYMAPEQTTVDQEITPAADVWSIGLIAFFVLTGKQYWKSANQKPCNLHSVIAETAYTTLASASDRAQELGCTLPLPAGFDAWFGRCVVRELDRRYVNAAEAYQALGPILSAAASAHPQRSVVGAEPLAPERPPSVQMGPPLTPWAPTLGTNEREKLLAFGALAVTLMLGGALIYFVRTHSFSSPVPTVDAGVIGHSGEKVLPSAPDLGRAQGPPAKEPDTIEPPSARTAEKQPAPEPGARAHVGASAAAPGKTARASAVPAECRKLPTNLLLSVCQDQKNARACHALGERYASGTCAKKKPGFAVLMWQRACQLGDESACAHL